MARLANLCLWLALFAATIHAQDTSPRHLYVYTLGKYFEPAVITGFEKQHNCTVHVDHYQDDRALFGAFAESGYDVVATSVASTAELRDRGQLLPLDHRILANLKHVQGGGPFAAFDPEWRYSVPFAAAPSGRGIAAAKGGVSDAEVFAVSAHTPVPDLAHRFINHIHDPEMARIIMEASHYLIPNRTALARLASDSGGDFPAAGEAAARLAFDYQ